MQWKLFLLLAWLVIGGGGCRTGLFLQTAALAPLRRRSRGEQTRPPVARHRCCADQGTVRDASGAGVVQEHDREARG